MRRIVLAAGVFAALFAVQAKTYDVRDYGARGDGTTKDTAAIQAAVDAAHAAGGGTVMLDVGTYLSGTIWLKSNVDFCIGMGAVVKGSPDLADYCAKDSYPQNWASPRESENQCGGHLFVAVEQRNIRLRGPGTIDGNGLHFATWPDGRERFHQRDYGGRPGMMLHVVECDGVRIEDLNLRNSTYWNCCLHGCEHVFVRGVSVLTPRSPHILNGDGFTIDACRFVTLTDCQIVGYDDGLTIRCVTRRLKNKLRECAHVTVANCTISSRMNAIRVGVGGGNIHDITFSNLAIHDTRTAVNFCSAWGLQGTPIRNVRLSGITVDAIDFLRMHNNGQKTPIDDVYISDVSGYVRQRARIWGTKGHPFRNIVLRNVDLNQGIEAVNVEGFRLIDCGLRRIDLTPEEIDSRNAELAAGRDILY